MNPQSVVSVIPHTMFIFHLRNKLSTYALRLEYAGRAINEYMFQVVNPWTDVVMNFSIVVDKERLIIYHDPGRIRLEVDRDDDATVLAHTVITYLAAREHLLSILDLPEHRIDFGDTHTLHFYAADIIQQLRAFHEVWVEVIEVGHTRVDFQIQYRFAGQYRILLTSLSMLTVNRHNFVDVYIEIKTARMHLPVSPLPDGRRAIARELMKLMEYVDASEIDR